LHIHYLQHEPFEGLAYIAEWAAQKGHTVSCTRLFADEPLPNHTAMDVLIIMGGGMGVYEDAKYPWLQEEKIFIGKVMESGKKVLGICLGAQLIASARGAAVYPNRQKEIGWFPIHPAMDNIQPQWLADMVRNHPVVFHWHGDTFDLPAGAALIASSEACRNQFFTIGDNIMGIQFHFEATIESAQMMIESGTDELQPAVFIQDAATIKSLSPKYSSSCNKAIQSLLDNWLP
jgi:GMP synthase-like glutamine amidotransferase